MSDTTLDEEEDEQTFKKPTQDQFMRIACRVLIRLEKAGTFTQLRRTEDFKTWVADHDEADEESWNRLKQVRSEMGA